MHQNNAKDSHIATSANIKWTLSYNNIFLTILLNSLMLVLAYSTHKLFHKHIVLGMYEDLNESVRAKGMLKPFSLVTQLRVGRVGGRGTSTLGGK